MTYILKIAPLVRRALPFCTALACAAPAFADHLGPSGFGSGGGMTVFDPSTLDAGDWAAGLRLTYTRPEQRSDAELEALAAQHIEAHNTAYNLNTSLSIAFGVTHHLSIAAEVPYVRRDSLREGEVGSEGTTDVARLGSVGGIGDVNLLAKFRLTEEGTGPGLAVIGGVKLPTGSTQERAAGGERLETEHQPGTGSWNPIIGVSASLPLRALQLTASALYQLSTTGAQETRLGNRLQGGIALSHRFGAAPHDHHDEEAGEEHHHHDHAHAAWDVFIELAGEWEGRQKVAGEIEEASGGAWIYAAPGVRFTKSRWSVSTSIAVPVWQYIRPSHPDNHYRLTMSLGRSF